MNMNLYPVSTSYWSMRVRTLRKSNYVIQFSQTNGMEWNRRFANESQTSERVSVWLPRCDFDTLQLRSQCDAIPMLDRNSEFEMAIHQSNECVSEPRNHENATHQIQNHSPQAHIESVKHFFESKRWCDHRRSIPRMVSTSPDDAIHHFDVFRNEWR